MIVHLHVLLICVLSNVLCSNINSAPTKQDDEVLQDDADEDTQYDVRDKTGCPAAFLKKCHCGYGEYTNKQMFIVNCTNAHFTDTQPLTRLPEETQVLIFTDNSLGILPNDLFGNTYAYQLDTIDLSRNRIKEIREDAFVGVGEVRTLILDHNDLIITDSELHSKVLRNFVNLESLHLTDAFTGLLSAEWYMSSLQIIFQASHLNRLIKLHLEQNDIRQLRDSMAFCSLVSLEQLYLGQNRLHDIDFSITCLPRLTYLDVSRNNIQRLTGQSLEQLDRVTARQPQFSVDFNENPFVCDCQLSGFVSWLNHTNTSVARYDQYTCVDRGDTLLIDTHLSDCRTPMTADDDDEEDGSLSSTGVVMGACAIVSFCCSLLVAVMVVRCRSREAALRRLGTASRHIRDKIEYVKHSRQYSSVEPDNEAVEVHV